MSEVFEQIAAIEESAVQAASVASLRDAPNRGGTYGADGLTAQKLKEKFDALPLLVNEKLHELITAYNNLVASITDGNLGNALKVNGLTLPDALKSLAADIIGDHGAETIKTIAALSAAIGNDPEFAVNVQAAIQKKADETTVQSLARAVGKKAESSTVTDLADTVSRKSAVKVSGNIVAEFDADAFADSVIALLVDGAPEALNTLREIAAALENDPNFAKGIIENAKKAAEDAAAEAVEGKLDKFDGYAGIYSVYGVGGEKNQTMFKAGHAPVGGRVAMFTTSGQLRGLSATDDDHLVPLAQMNEALAEKDEEIGILRKRVVNLEQGITPDPYLTDDSVAYVKDIPANALPYARLEAVGGMTYRNVTEIPLDDAYNLFADEGNWGAETEATILEMFPGAVVGETYELVYMVSEEGGRLDPYDRSTFSELGNPFTLTEDAVLRCYAYANNGNMHTEFWDARLVKDGGIRETKVTAVSSYGASVLPYPYPASPAGVTVKNGVTLRQLDDGTLLLDGIAEKNISHFLYTEYDGLSLPDEGVYIDGVPYPGTTLNVKTGYSGDVYKIGRFIPSPKDVLYGRYIVFLYIPSGTVLNEVKIQPSITRGLTQRTGVRYRATQSIVIPNEVQAMPGYGQGKDETAYNHIRWNDDGTVHYIRMVDADLNPLATPEVTDISHLITRDNFLPVEGGGVIIAANENADAAPTTIKYQLKEG